MCVIFATRSERSFCYLKRVCWSISRLTQSIQRVCIRIPNPAMYQMFRVYDRYFSKCIKTIEVIKFISLFLQRLC